MKSFVSLALVMCGFSVYSLNAGAEVVLYTDRPASRLAPAATEFKARTGENLIVLEMPYPDIVKRMDADLKAGQPTADLVFVKDMVYLAELVAAGSFQPNPSQVVVNAVEPQFKDPNNLWAAISFRARTLVYNADSKNVNPDEINTYEDLASEKWAGKLCVRTAKGGYNEALVSSFIANMGYDAAKKVVQGMVDNFAVEPFKNDNAMIEAIANGQCEIGVSNSYYLAGYHAKNSNFPVKIKFLNQATTGTHVNGSGIGITATSKQADLAAKFIELLLEEKYQLQMSSEHLDFPARKGLLPNTFIKDWGTFKTDSLDWTATGALAPKARELMSEVGYN